MQTEYLFFFVRVMFLHVLAFIQFLSFQSDDEDALDEPERPLKRLRRRGGEVVSTSASNSPSLGSPCLNETTTHHDQETVLVSLPFHPKPTENDPDAAGALVMPKGEPFTDIPSTSTHQGTS